MRKGLRKWKERVLIVGLGHFPASHYNVRCQWMMRTLRVVTGSRWGDERLMDESAVRSPCWPLIGLRVATLASDWSLSIACVPWPWWGGVPSPGRGLAPGMRLAQCSVSQCSICSMFPHSHVSRPTLCSRRGTQALHKVPSAPCSRDQINSAISRPADKSPRRYTSPLYCIWGDPRSSDNKPRGRVFSLPSILSDWYVSLRVVILYPQKCDQ